MADTDKLRPYNVGPFPSIEASVPAYVAEELSEVAASIAQCIVALQALEARLVAGGL